MRERKITRHVDCGNNTHPAFCWQCIVFAGHPMIPQHPPTLHVVGDVTKIFAMPFAGVYYLLRTHPHYDKLQKLFNEAAEENYVVWFIESNSMVLDAGTLLEGEPVRRISPVYFAMLESNLSRLSAIEILLLNWKMHQAGMHVGGVERIVSLFEEILASNLDLSTNATLIFALSQMLPCRRSEVLVPYLRSEHTLLRASAAIALVEMCGKEAPELVLQELSAAVVNLTSLKSSYAGLLRSRQHKLTASLTGALKSLGRLAGEILPQIAESLDEQSDEDFPVVLDMVLSCSFSPVRSRQERLIERQFEVITALLRSKKLWLRKDWVVKLSHYGLPTDRGEFARIEAR